jgi:hypothetical protein
VNSAAFITTSRPASRARFRRGFSIIEVVVVVGLMSFIVLGLVIMFGQTQRAYKLGMTQVDVLEGGRATIDMMGRELAVLTPSRGDSVVNFYADIPAAPTPVILRQLLPGAKPIDRLNSVRDFYFLTRDNQTWTGIGYRIGNREAGVGTLYRYEQTTQSSDLVQGMFLNFFNGYVSTGFTTNQNRPIDNQLNLNISRLVDGVVHFRVRPYDRNGAWITNEFAVLSPSGFYDRTNIALAESTFVPGEIRYFGMYSNLVPAAVELELGILEDAVLAKAKAIPDLNRRYDYLTNQASKVHLFRLRVPVRNVDPSAYQ